MGRRILKWFSIVAAALLSLAMIGVGLLHTGAGKELVRSKIEAALAARYDGVVSLGEIDYALFGDVSVRELHIADDAGVDVIALRDLTLSLDWTGLLGGGGLAIDRLGVDGVDVDLVAYEDGSNNLRRMQKRPLKLPQGGQLLVREIDVKDVNVRLTRPDGSITRLSGVAVHGAAELDGAAQTADIDLDTLAAEITLERPGVLKAVLPLSTGLTLARSGQDLTLRTKAIDTTARVERAGAEPLDVPVKIGAIEANRLADVIGLALSGVEAGPLALAALEVDARLDAKGRPVGAQRFALAGLKVTKDTLNTLLGRELLRSDIAADVAVAGPPAALRLTGDVRTEGGVFTLRGDADITDPLAPVYDLRLSGKDIDSKRLIAAADVPAVRTGMTLTAKGKGLAPGSADADVTFVLDPTIVAGRSLDGVTLEAGARGGVYSLKQLSVSAFGQLLTLDGELDRTTRKLRATLKTTTAVADAVAKARDAGVLTLPLPPLSGELDVDLTLTATLKPVGFEVGAQAEPAQPLAMLKLLPVEEATLKGHVRGRDVKAAEREIGALDVAVDLRLGEDVPQGTLTVGVRDADLGAATVDQADLTLGVDGLRQTIALAVRDAAQRLAVDLGVDASVDPAARRVTATIKTLDVQRGALSTRLQEPVTLDLAQPSPGGQDQRFTLPAMTLSLAGGQVTVGGSARFRRDPDHPEAHQLAHLRATVEAAGLSLRRLAALGRRSTRGVRGTLSGSLAFDGTPADPDLDFGLDVRARAGRGAAPALLRVRGGVHDRRLSGDVRVIDVATKGLLAQAKVKAPLSVGSGEPPSLAPGGRLSFDLDVPRRSLAEIGRLLPGGRLPPGADPDATVAASAKLVGTPARPTGEWSLQLEGGLAKSDVVALPPRQRLSLSGSLAQVAGKTRLDGQLGAWLDAAGAKTLDLDVQGRFDRSPLLRTGLRRPWHLDLVLGEVDLAALPTGGRIDGGRVSGKLALHGDARDLTGDLQLDAAGVRAGGDPAADLGLSLALGDEALTLNVEALAGGLPVVTVAGTVGVPGKGLRRLIRRKGKLQRAPLDLALRVPKRPLAEWGALAPKPITVPGDFGGELRVTGTVGAPQIRGGLAYDGFTTLSGDPGRVGIALDGGASAVEATLQLGALTGAKAPVELAVAVDPAQLLDAAGPLDVGLVARAAAVDLLSLVPRYALGDGQVLDVAGILDWRLDGALRLLPTGEGARALDAATSGLDGELSVHDGRLVLPGTERVVRDVALTLDVTPDNLGLTLAAREADRQRADRRVRVTGDVALDAFMPQRAVLKVNADDWLVLGLGLDDPEGELDMAMTVTATALSSPVKDVDVLIESLHLDAPSRFVRAHRQKILDWGDVVFLDESGLPSGKLPGGPKAAPAGAGLVAGAAGGAPAEPTGVDVHLRIPEPIRVTKDPLDLQVKGALEAALRGDDLDIQGAIEMVDGEVGAMGWSWHAVRGTIGASGGLDTFAVELVFARPLHATAMRDIARDSGGGLSTLTVTIDMVNGQAVTFGGASGPYLLDAASELNQGVARVYTRADLPASGGVRFGEGLQSLVATFVQTNVRNLIFMDRAHGWSDSVDDPRQYGRIWNFVGERYLNDDATRVRLFAQPPSRIGQNQHELQYDWLLTAEERSVAGFGARLGTDLRLGLGLFWEFYSKD
ncbi:MAG: hypothetical protein CSA66_07020 [Proteobacteria bacterium]|nr:MAG: hypothetical protein CSA66_07020 [Pseudomonadota bacterium]